MITIKARYHPPFSKDSVIIAKIIRTLNWEYIRLGDTFIIASDWSSYAFMIIIFMLEIIHCCHVESDLFRWVKSGFAIWAWQGLGTRALHIHIGLHVPTEQLTEWKMKIFPAS